MTARGRALAGPVERLHAGLVTRLRTFGLCAALLWSFGCRHAAPVDCDAVPTTADGCRERCHDRGAEMGFFRYDPTVYRCDAVCECSGGP